MGSPLKILHLEDNPADAELIDSWLHADNIDCEVQRVATQQEYESALESGGFDLILSDYTLPGFDGMTALAMAREKRPEVPFLFVSGTIGEERAIEGLKQGAIDFVIKDRFARSRSRASARRGRPPRRRCGGARNATRSPRAGPTTDCGTGISSAGPCSSRRAGRRCWASRKTSWATGSRSGWAA
jgi:DNA-binding response OmpR family regulator